MCQSFTGYWLLLVIGRVFVNLKVRWWTMKLLALFSWNPTEKSYDLINCNTWKHKTYLSPLFPVMIIMCKGYIKILLKKSPAVIKHAYIVRTQMENFLRHYIAASSMFTRKNFHIPLFFIYTMVFNKMETETHMSMLKPGHIHLILLPMMISM